MRHRGRGDSGAPPKAEGDGGAAEWSPSSRVPHIMGSSREEKPIRKPSFEYTGKSKTTINASYEKTLPAGIRVWSLTLALLLPGTHKI